MICHICKKPIDYLTGFRVLKTSALGPSEGGGSAVIHTMCELETTYYHEEFTKEMGRMFARAGGTPVHVVPGHTPRRMSNCPYCHASTDADAPGVRYYECGTRCVVDPNVRYAKECGR